MSTGRKRMREHYGRIDSPNMQGTVLYGGTVLNSMGNVFLTGIDNILKAHENGGSR
jgi:hypothetical protein